MPACASHRRGGGLPSIGSRERPFTTNPPSAQVHQAFELQAVGERAGGGQHRIAQVDAAERRRQPRVRLRHWKASPSTLPMLEDGYATPASRAIVGATSIASHGASKVRLRKAPP